MIRSPQHELIRFLNSLSEPVLQHYSKYIVKDSFKFNDELKHFKPNDTCPSSFDVKSLFTNEALNEVIDTCADELYSLENQFLREIISF